MQQILLELLQKIQVEYYELMEVQLLIQDLNAIGRITDQEVELIMNSAIKTSTFTLVQLFKKLRPKTDDTICDLQRICRKNGWEDVNATIENFLRSHKMEDLIVEVKPTSVAKPPPDLITDKLKKFYEVEVEVYKDVPPTEGVIENLIVESVDSPPTRDSGTYENFSKPKGLALIINNRKFDNDDLPERKGTDVDAINIGTLFDKLGYTVIIKENLKSTEIMQKMKNFAKKEEHKSCHSAVVIILTHGNRDILYGTDNKAVRVEDIVACLDSVNCPDLKGKPKIFIIQACRGEKHDLGQDFADGLSFADTLSQSPKELLTHLDEADIGAFKKIPTGADVLIAYATTPGYVSWRNCATGSWFIQAICEVFRAKAKSEEILHLFTSVNAVVAERFSKSGHVQISEPSSRLRKKFYFYPGYSDCC